MIREPPTLYNHFQGHIVPQAVHPILVTRPSLRTTAQTDYKTLLYPYTELNVFQQRKPLTWMTASLLQNPVSEITFFILIPVRLMCPCVFQSLSSYQQQSSFITVTIGDHVCAMCQHICLQSPPEAHVTTRGHSRDCCHYMTGSGSLAGVICDKSAGF